MTGHESLMVTIANDELLIVSLSGTIDSGAALELARELNRIEAGGAYPKRIVFVDENLRVALKSDDAMLYKSQRPEPQTVVQTAFCVFTDLQYGIARMFQSLLESDKHSIKIFRDRETAAQWLNVDVGLLKAQSA
jgi:hypothetical protein